jgi:hypothetical protein
MTSLFLMVFGLMLATAPIIQRLAEGEDEPLVWLALQGRARRRFLGALSVSGVILFLMGVVLP